MFRKDECTLDFTPKHSCARSAPQQPIFRSQRISNWRSPRSLTSLHKKMESGNLLESGNFLIESSHSCFPRRPTLEGGRPAKDEEVSFSWGTYEVVREQYSFDGSRVALLCLNAWLESFHELRFWIVDTNEAEILRYIFPGRISSDLSRILRSEDLCRFCLNWWLQSTMQCLHLPSHQKK